MLRLRCLRCDEIWAAEKIEQCPCGSENVEHESLNDALNLLGDAEERVEQLLSGIREHVTYLREHHGRLVGEPERV